MSREGARYPAIVVETSDCPTLRRCAPLSLPMKGREGQPRPSIAFSSGRLIFIVVVRGKAAMNLMSTGTW